MLFLTSRMLSSSLHPILLSSKEASLEKPPQPPQVGPPIVLFQSVVVVAVVVVLAMPHSMGDLSSPTRDQTLCPLQWKRGVLTTGPPGKSLFQSFDFFIAHISICYYFIGLLSTSSVRKQVP